MNYTGDRRSILTLAHELGHGLHGALSQPLGLYNASTPLTTAETASVFGEALTFKRLLATEDDPRRRLDLLAGRLEDAIATVFRQIAMNRFEHAVHTERREVGELAPERFGELWLEQQAALFADAVDLDGYTPWWSYIPHFTGVPGYVYAYAYGFLFSLAIYRRYEQEGDAMVEPYLELLRAGGSRTPEELAAARRARSLRPGHLGRGHRGARRRPRRGGAARGVDRRSPPNRLAERDVQHLGNPVNGR